MMEIRSDPDPIATTTPKCGQNLNQELSDIKNHRIPLVFPTEVDTSQQNSTTLFKHESIPCGPCV